MTRENRSFKNFLIYPSFQWRLILMMMSMSFVSIFSLVIFQLFSLQALTEMGGDYHLPENHPYFQFLKQFQDSFLMILISAIVVSVIFSLLFGMLLSHKVAGPLVKMRHFFNEVADKKNPDAKIFFRQGDFFQDVADAYNRRFDS